MTENIPRWDLSNIYKGLDDPQLKQDLAAVQNDVASLTTFFDTQLLPLQDAPAGAERLSDLAQPIGGSIKFPACQSGYDRLLPLCHYQHRFL